MQNVKTKKFFRFAAKWSALIPVSQTMRKNKTGTTRGSQLAQHTQWFRIPDDGMLSASSSPGRTPYVKEEGSHCTFKTFKGVQSDKVHRESFCTTI